MSNYLINETSPYLLQHARNPVNWYPWCEEAFERARQEDKPVFLSIGYSTCHWCHVMAHESFEDDKTAKILNEHFIAIKVDREERPDIDSVYMTVCQMMTGSGGWPMSIFMTWDKKPFFAGTYFPPVSRYGMPAFSELLNIILKHWSSDKTKLLKLAEEIILNLRAEKNVYDGGNNEDLTRKAADFFRNNFDRRYGGFGSAPKFPTPHNLMFLMMYSKQNNDLEILKMVEKTLMQMRKGGIFDHIGYGFSRYSTDMHFLVPHFEKMLYDNALLIIAYAAAYKMTDNRIYLDTAEKTAEYVLNEMTSCDGGFYSAQDADSEGVEGKYYTFSLNEITDVLGKERGMEFAEAFDITKNGNFEGVNIPNLLKSNDTETDFREEIKKLYRYRKDRFRLHLDDKILLSWNSLMIAGLSVLYRATRNERYILAARKAEEFIRGNLCDGLRLYTSFRDGKRSQKSFFDDYAFYIAALIELYNSTLDDNYSELATRLCDESVRWFADDKDGGFYLCDTDSTELFINPKEAYDGAIPSGNSVMAYNFTRLYQLTGERKYAELFERQERYLSGEARQHPAGYGMFLVSLLLHRSPLTHITVVLKELSDMKEVIKRVPFMADISVVSESAEYPLLNGKTTYYICTNYKCLPPTNVLEM